MLFCRKHAGTTPQASVFSPFCNVSGDGTRRIKKKMSKFASIKIALPTCAAGSSTHSYRMENPYVKQFPDLMSGKKIMYVHGFGSSAQSGTVTLLRTLMPEATVVARDIPIHPADAMAMLTGQCSTEQPDLIIGTSMGGMYAEQLKGFDRILVNPAFQMGETMSKHGMTGKQVFSNPRTDGVQEFIVTKALVKEYAEATERCFDNIDDEERKRVFGLFGDEDPLVHTFDLFRRHYPSAMHFHGGHRLTDNVALHYLVPVIRWIDDRQARRQRPVVLIDTASLIDSYGNATASMHKAFEILIERYDVYILAGASTNAPERMDYVRSWVEKYLSTPAHDRIVYSNNIRLLYADYLVTDRPQPDFLGTTIVWGSDGMKTWEEIITFFDRLGGQ